MAAGGAAIDFDRLPYIYSEWCPETHWHFPSLDDLPGGIFSEPTRRTSPRRGTLLPVKKLILPLRYRREFYLFLNPGTLDSVTSEGEPPDSDASS